VLASVKHIIINAFVLGAINMKWNHPRHTMVTKTHHFLVETFLPVEIAPYQCNGVCN
jgi:hypothetical protein